MEIEELKAELRTIFLQYSHIKSQAQAYEKQAKYLLKCHDDLMQSASDLKPIEEDIINKLELKLSEKEGTPIKLEVADLVKIIKEDAN